MAETHITETSSIPTSLGNPYQHLHQIGFKHPERFEKIENNRD